MKKNIMNNDPYEKKILWITTLMKKKKIMNNDPYEEKKIMNNDPYEEKKNYE